MHIVSAGATMKSVVPQGYKHTEVGVIPEDWEVSNLESITDPKRVISYGIVQTGPNMQNGIRCLRVVDIDDGKINSGDMIATSKTISDSYKRTILKAEDLVMPLRGKVGDIAIVSEDLAGCNLTRGVALIAVRQDWSARYCRQYISSSFTRKRLEQSMNGSALQEIPIAALRSFNIALPSTKAEQEAIAKALSDTDALIESLEQLIAKKRQIKQGAMQELLTGKRRLPGFSGEWEVKLFDEIVRLRKERIDPRRSEAAEFCIELEHIQQGTGCLVGYTETGGNSSLKSVFQKEDVLFGKLRAYLRKFWLANRAGVCSTEIWVLAAKTAQLTPTFLFQIIKVDSFVEAASTAYGTHMPRSDWNVVKNYEVPLPPIAEQTAIATILSDMDAEITALKEKLAKTRQLKQGMMHNLLTGRIRLIKPTFATMQHHTSTSTERPAAPKLDKPHTWAFNEAVVISVLADQFAKPEFPLGRKRYTKLSYLMHRMTEQAADGYLKKAAGPYNPKTKYAGPERIALENGYIREHQNGKFRGFVAAEKIEQAKAYFIKWYGENIGAWLEQFRRRSNDDLERLATVDMAMQDLLRQGKAVDVASVRALIASEPEWLPKLERPVFSDAGIAAAIAECRAVFKY